MSGPFGSKRSQLLVPSGIGPTTVIGRWKFNEGTGLIAGDDSGYGNDGDLIGMDNSNWITSYHASAGTALAFDNPSYVEVPYSASMATPSEMSIAFYLRRNEYPARSFYVLSQYDFAANKRTWAIRIPTSSSNFSLSTSVNGTTFESITTNVNASTGWEKYAFVTPDSGKTWRIFTGSAFTQQVTSTNGYANQSSKFYIGGLDNGAVSMHADIDNIIWESRAWDDAEAITMPPAE